MKWLIASDIHGSAYYCEKLISAFNKEKADKMIILGDILYHGPRNDLPEGYAPKSVISMLNPLKDKLLCVRGNCDTEVDQMVLDFPILADYALLPIGDNLIFITHGHKFNTTAIPPLSDGDILLHGHTHVPKCEKFGDFIYMNPGSVSIPKEDSPHGYMTLDDGNFLWKSFDGDIYMEYTF
ncbi:MAG: phosphodiesterase [Ruminococcaceae bacterium]|nr:phosphodiesterase [Oscillospiraceae bacterium]